MTTLTRISRGDIVLHKPLPHHLRDAEGNVMLEAGTVLDKITITVLPEEVFIDTNPADSKPSETDDSMSGYWSADTGPHRAASAYDIVGMVFERLGKSKPVGNERRFERRPWTVTLHVVVQTDLDRRELEVTTHDLSKGGFCFLYRQYVPVGARVSTKFNMLPGSPVLEGEVRNCIHLTGMQHRVGVSFDLQQGRTAPKQT